LCQLSGKRTPPFHFHPENLSAGELGDKHWRLDTSCFPEVKPFGQMGHALFIPESFGGWDGDGVAGGQHAGEECAESKECGGCEQTACGKGALHPVGENGTEKAVKGKADDHARGCADDRDARGDPQNMRARRAERQADAELRSALRDAVSDDAEDANQREPERHGREDIKQYGEEPLAVVLCVRSMASLSVNVAALEICWSDATDAIAARMERREVSGSP